MSTTTFDTTRSSARRYVGTWTVINVTTEPVEAALWLARAFAGGRRLAVWAPGCEDHAHHVAVEFMHPVTAGAQALPARAITHDAAPQDLRHNDALLVIGAPDQPAIRLAVTDASDTCLLIDAHHDTATIVRSYHLLWELVQIALEHPGLVGGPATEHGDPTGFLYPFLDAAESDEVALGAALASSAVAKGDDSRRVVREARAANSTQITNAADVILGAVAGGGGILTMGNGGSATDAARLVRMLTGRGIDAQSLSADYAVLSALANDVGAERIFARQVDACGRPGDVLVGFSTSGASPNLLAAFDRAAATGITTIAITGYGGGSLRDHAGVDHILSVDSVSVHRIQEAQAALVDDLCAALAPTAAES